MATNGEFLDGTCIGTLRYICEQNGRWELQPALWIGLEVRNQSGENAVTTYTSLYQGSGAWPSASLSLLKV